MKLPISFFKFTNLIKIFNAENAISIYLANFVSILSDVKS